MPIEGQAGECGTPVAVAADHRLRSVFMQALIVSPRRTTLAGGGRSRPPRVIVQFWDDLARVPPDVQLCLDSWAGLEPLGWRREIFDDQSAARYIAEHLSDTHARAFKKCAHPAMRSDYFRLCYLSVDGGVYVDADDEYVGGPLDSVLAESRLQVQPLCYELSTEAMLEPFAAALKGPTGDRTFYVNNNPLIAPRAHPLVATALERATGHVLEDSDNRRDIQAMTGPGNLTAVLVEHAVDALTRGEEPEFTFLRQWEDTARSRWPLGYRSDERNWRNWARGRG